MTTWADRDAVEEAVESWSAQQIACRAYNHTWRPLQVAHRPGVYTIRQRCSRCRNIRQQDMDEQGYLLSPWHINYRHGYLLEKKGRIGADGRAVLRLATLRSLTIVEVDDE